MTKVLAIILAFVGIRMFMSAYEHQLECFFYDLNTKYFKKKKYRKR